MDANYFSFKIKNLIEKILNVKKLFSKDKNNVVYD
jgi:hypothetical protein